MDAYMFGGALYCAECGQAIRNRLTAAGQAPVESDDESSFDSDDYPKGPYADGGGEADSPQYCDACNAFLGNPLTSEGYDYVREAAADSDSSSGIIREWLDYYDIEVDNYMP